ncbi:MAG: AbrB/MazE/SpoVT family DNA-binding domain-containing protein, partial [Sporolactobacillus sp.]
VYTMYILNIKGDTINSERTSQGRGVAMTSKVQMWGNSLAIRLPKAVVKSAGVERGSEYAFAVEDEKIVLIPSENSPTLAELLAKITPENRHKEIELGQEGNELT